MGEISFVSKDGIMYKGVIDDVIELTKKQRNKLKELASVKTSSEIAKEGLSLHLEDDQEQAILKELRKRTFSEENDIKQRIKKVIQCLRFTTHAEYDRMPDPERSLSSRVQVAECLIGRVKVRKFKVNVPPGETGLHRKLSHTIESEIGRGNLAIAFSGEKHILIITVLP